MIRVLNTNTVKLRPEVGNIYKLNTELKVNMLDIRGSVGFSHIGRTTSR